MGVVHPDDRAPVLSGGKEMAMVLDPKGIGLIVLRLLTVVLLQGLVSLPTRRGLCSLVLFVNCPKVSRP